MRSTLIQTMTDRSMKRFDHMYRIIWRHPIVFLFKCYRKQSRRATGSSNGSMQRRRSASFVGWLKWSMSFGISNYSDTSGKIIMILVSKKDGGAWNWPDPMPSSIVSVVHTVLRRISLKNSSWRSGTNFNETSKPYRSICCNSAPMLDNGNHPSIHIFCHMPSRSSSSRDRSVCEINLITRRRCLTSMPRITIWFDLSTGANRTKNRSVLVELSKRGMNPCLPALDWRGEKDLANNCGCFPDEATGRNSSWTNLSMSMAASNGQKNESDNGRAGNTADNSDHEPRAAC